jgi:hypothetical protein
MVRHAKQASERPRFRAPMLGLSTYSKALLLAVSAHAALLTYVGVRRYQSHATQPVRPNRELHVELEFGAAPAKDAIRDARVPGESAIPSNARASALSAPSPSRAALASASSVPKPAASDLTTPNDSNSPIEPEGSAAAAPAVVSASSASGTERKINLGINGELFRLLDAERAANPVVVARKETRKRDAGAELTHGLTAALLADDLRHGRARGNVLLGTLHSAVRQLGPTRGQAVIRVTVNGSGEVTGVELNRGTEEEWTEVLRAFKQRVQSKRVRVPDGAAGLRITFSVAARVQRPSGKDVESGAVSVARPSLAPDGLTPHGTFDLADLSNKTARMLAVRIINEEIL